MNQGKPRDESHSRAGVILEVRVVSKEGARAEVKEFRLTESAKAGLRIDASALQSPRAQASTKR